MVLVLSLGSFDVVGHDQKTTFPSDPLVTRIEYRDNDDDEFVLRIEREVMAPVWARILV